jgi:AcrR family transcriptional regulator
VDVADAEGLDAVTMRRLGAELGVEAMSLYKHVAGKDEILDGMVELVIGAIELPVDTTSWKEAMRGRASSARAVLGRHSWAIGLLESRPRRGPVVRRYLDDVIGVLRAAGFSIEDAAHAFWVLDNHVYGQIVQEAGVASVTASGEADAAADPDVDGDRAQHRHLAELAEYARRSDPSVDREFEFGLELILDALERRLD